MVKGGLLIVDGTYFVLNWCVTAGWREILWHCCLCLITPSWCVYSESFAHASIAESRLLSLANGYVEVGGEVGIAGKDVVMAFNGELNWKGIFSIGASEYLDGD